MTLVDLTGRVVIVTGASSGLGDQFARALHAVGVQVIAVTRRRSGWTCSPQNAPGSSHGLVDTLIALPGVPGDTPGFSAPGNPSRAG
jgi:NAD(P)-dependent dehydrogenase (short-subunit alcohol dehydrogenase family)